MNQFNFLSMIASKYKKPFIYFLIYVIAFSILFLMLEPLIGDQDISPIILGDNFIEKMQLFFVWWTLGSIIGALLFGFILGPFYLFVHKHTIGRKMSFGIQDNRESEKLKWLSKAIFPSLMAVNFALMLTLYPRIINEIVSISVGMNSDIKNVFYTLLAFVILLSFTVGVAFAIFSPVWFLQDAGIVYSNQD